MKRYLSVCLILMLLLSMAAPVYADGIIGEIETEVEIRGLTEFNVRMLVSRYFAQRKAYLQGTAETIDVVVPAMVTDEAAHKQAIEEANAVLLDSTVVINEVAFWDEITPVSATETVSFRINEQIIQETVTHEIVVLFDSDGCLYVTSDSYSDSLFSSAAYVPPEIQAAAELNAGGSSSCILTVAYSQLGVTEAADGSTKYGIWYGNLKDDTWFYSADWCTMFVSWCANEANVDTWIIPCYDSAPYLQEWFDGYYRFYTPNSSSYSPRAGDLFFYRTSRTDKDGNLIVSEYGHVGFIYSVSGNYIYIVDGNTGDPDRVKYDYMSINNPILTGFARPNYASTSHSYSSYLYYDEMGHWSSCQNCGTRTTKTSHSYSSDLQYDESAHWQCCQDCGARTTKTAHSYVGGWQHNGSGHWRNCQSCKIGSVIISHTMLWNVDHYECVTCGRIGDDSIIINNDQTENSEEG